MRTHQLARKHVQVAQAAADTWTKDQVITAIRNLEAPYDQVGARGSDLYSMDVAS
jgi:hypothetical protein